jgi:hypothetical protein
MSDSDIHTTVLSDSWAFYCNSLRLRHSVCEQSMKESLSTLKIVWRMFTAYHLKTDRTTEWMNQNVELYICTFFNYSQNNWANLLLMTELVINNHDFISTEMSFFFLSHEYYMKSLQLFEKLSLYDLWEVQYRKLIKLYKRWKKSQSEHRWLWLSLSRYRKDSELKRQQSYNFKKEDKIWLNLKNIHTDCSYKKFDVKNVKYIIVKKISSHFFCLNTLLSIHNVFHSVMLQSAVMNALSSQCMTDLQSHHK